tara:strand:+ start:41688 stop:42380 length:693 start_codon:yes stop_codon:yes gene_type:complete
MKNFDQQELEKFTQLANQWWDPNGKFKPLHLINPLRSDYINKKINVSGKSVLDVGCGGGILSESLARKGAKVTGIDLSEGPLKVAQIRNEKVNLDIDYKKISTNQLVDSGEKFDVIACLEMLEHVPDPSEIVSDCEKLLKKNGHIFFSTINRNLKSFVFAILGAEYILNILPQGTHDFEKLIKPSELRNYIDKSGLFFEEIRGMSYLPFFDIAKLTDDPSVNYIIHARKK